ncbi:LLM class flavin-dependent oxidoreductase [Actinomadura parmotrematis]|uniref:LLM class flavin-dependent oxidoreductase n=1 Tax=Actinomadura parmotrematis TaxID=2864039 RepID=A0ABS7FNU8_9ACTN|nr:LLM class flavin-dependent oxidoreductase [Actinomadura parmotrematis]MBW8481253.1 LLM class flavin-dependent oxidoreductase [Actinomadura parmotrematis]
MKFYGVAPIRYLDAAGADEPAATRASFDLTVATALRMEELGFDGFGVGERHHWPFLSSAPPVVLSHVAALTRRIRLFTGVTLLSMLDPLRVAEDYATLDHLSGGRLELIVGKGAGPGGALFGLTPDQQRPALADNFRLLHELWTSDEVSWRAQRRPRLDGVRSLPRPLNGRPRIWHGSSSSLDSVALAAEYGDPVVFSNAGLSSESARPLVEHYRAEWARHGRPADRLFTGAGTPGFLVAKTSQAAVAAYRPAYERLAAMQRSIGARPPFASVEDFIARSPALVGSPAQVIDKVHRQHEVFGHSLIVFSVDPDGLAEDDHRASLELFAGEVAPALRTALPDPPP